MKFRIFRTSDSGCWLKDLKQPAEKAYRINNYWYINIDTIQELTDLQIKCGFSIILVGNRLEIYDCYRE